MNIWKIFGTACGMITITVVLIFTLFAALESTGYFDWIDGGGIRVGTGEKPIVGVWPEYDC